LHLTTGRHVEALNSAKLQHNRFSNHYCLRQVRDISPKMLSLVFIDTIQTKDLLCSSNFFSDIRLLYSDQLVALDKWKRYRQRQMPKHSLATMCWRRPTQAHSAEPRLPETSHSSSSARMLCSGALTEGNMARLGTADRDLALLLSGSSCDPSFTTGKSVLTLVPTEDIFSFHILPS